MTSPYRISKHLVLILRLSVDYEAMLCVVE